MKKLINIKNRYFRNGRVCHFGDCDIYRSSEVYGGTPCNCGLLLDLFGVIEYAEHIYPDFYCDVGKTDGLTYDEIKSNKEAQERILGKSSVSCAILDKIEEVFGKQKELNG